MVAVFHHIGEPTPDLFTHSITQIQDYDGQVTFDGVYESVFHHRLELPDACLLFVSGNQIGRDGYCNFEQIIKLRDLGHRIGWHGWSHDRLTQMNATEIMAELDKPAWIEPIYAYPHGDFSLTATAILEDLGYEVAYSTTQGQMGNRYAIPRYYI